MADKSTQDRAWYRRDRIPCCSFRECLSHQPDYPLRQADDLSGIPFYDPSAIPDSDVAFNSWFRRHVTNFFEIDDATIHQLLMHEMEHKRTGATESASFDAVAADGIANHVKLTQSAGGWQVHDVKIAGIVAIARNRSCRGFWRPIRAI